MSEPTNKKTRTVTEPLSGTAELMTPARVDLGPRVQRSRSPTASPTTTAMKAATWKPMPTRRWKNCCLCLSIGARPSTDALQRVFGSACHAAAASWPS
jgi:hypothetical protein